jgi:uncharacterized protein (TIGR00369 family)
MTPVMTEAELTAFMWRAFPQAAEDFLVERLTEDGIVMRLKVADKHLRPGGTISGPSIFGLADVSVYLAILARIGPVALAVTTGGGIDFLRKPEAGVDLLGEARLLKLGRSLAVGDVLIRSEGQEAPVARSNMTYSIPPRREEM